MSLRTRLLLGLIGAFLVFIAAAVFAVGAQRDQLFDQLDARLLNTPLPRASDPASGSGGANGDASGGRSQPQPGADGPVLPNQSAAQPISDLYMARIEPDGSVVTFIEGTQLTDRPNLQQLLDNPPGERAFATLPGEAGVSDFRSLYIPAPQPGIPPTIVALPMDDVQATAKQLIWIFGGVAALMALALGLVGYWVNRFGINPITQMTATAEAIATGDREQRAEHYSANTEVGRLADAFNVMLDERDEAENRLRHFISDASHELRTPLTSIRGYLDLYSEGGFRQPGQLDDAIRRMQAESARMNLLVEDLLLLAKLDEQQGLQLAPVDLGIMLDDVAASALAAKPERSIDVAVDLPTGLTVQADPLRLQQAVAALIDNALTHTPQNAQVRLSAQAGQPTSGQPAVTVTVSDDGPGIAADLLDKVFDRFQRADASRSRQSGGSGLGLSISKAIVEAHGGTITAESAPNQGATFTISLAPNPDMKADTGRRGSIGD